jgi:hypothetical protein
MGARTNLQVIIRRREPQFLKKDSRHVVIVVLASMDQHLAVLAPQRPAYRRSLDKLRPGANHRDDFHTADSAPANTCASILSARAMTCKASSTRTCGSRPSRTQVRKCCNSAYSGSTGGTYTCSISPSCR